MTQKYEQVSMGTLSPEKSGKCLKPAIRRFLGICKTRFLHKKRVLASLNRVLSGKTRSVLADSIARCTVMVR